MATPFVVCGHFGSLLFSSFLHLLSRSSFVALLTSPPRSLSSVYNISRITSALSPCVPPCFPHPRSPSFDFSLLRLRAHTGDFLFVFLTIRVECRPPLLPRVPSCHFALAVVAPPFHPPFASLLLLVHCLPRLDPSSPPPCDSAFPAASLLSACFAVCLCSARTITNTHVIRTLTNTVRQGLLDAH